MGLRQVGRGQGAAGVPRVPKKPEIQDFCSCENSGNRGLFAPSGWPKASHSLSTVGDSFLRVCGVSLGHKGHLVPIRVLV